MSESAWAYVTGYVDGGVGGMGGKYNASMGL